MSARHKDIVTPQAASTLDGLLQERVRRTPDGAAYHACERETGRWLTVTWAEVAGQVGRWQRALAAEGLQPGDRVALALRNCTEWVCFDQAALGLGLVVVPLYTEDRPDALAYILEHCGAKVLLLHDAGHWSRLEPALRGPNQLRRVLLLGERGAGQAPPASPVRWVDDWLPAEPAAPQARQGDPHALASIVYTSGTTGRPKGVMLSHYNMLSVAGAALDLIDCYREDVFLSFLPLSHALERTGGYYLPMMAGASVAFARSVNQLAEDLRAIRPTMLIAVPRVFERVYTRIRQRVAGQPALRRWLFETATRVGWARFEHAQGRRRWSPQLLAWPVLERLVAHRVLQGLGGRLRLAVSGGAALVPAVGRLFLGLGLPLVQGYGLTETSPVVSVNTPEDNDPSSVGVPLPGIQVRLGPDDELLVKSPGVMLGYWNDAQASAQVLDGEGWLRTGDRARLDGGHVYLTGRLKDILVLSNGEKVAPADMEGAITLDDLFESAMVVGEGEPFLAAILVLGAAPWEELARGLGLDPLAPASLEDPRAVAAVQARLAARLGGFPGYAKVRRLILSLDPWTVDNGLLTPTMKVRRRLVLERFAGRMAALYQAPAGRARRV
jgi:long-chain acyl-CoA synthetase